MKITPRHSSDYADTTNLDCDVVIAGAGPAGASAAIRLALDGWRVVLLEANQFPRHKLCGEFISPECLLHFNRLGVEASLRAARPTRIVETVFYTERGHDVHVPSEWFGNNVSAAALGLSRSEMDARLLARAREVGVDVREQAKATSVMLNAEEGVRGVRYKCAGNSEKKVTALITLDATGRTRALSRLAGHNLHSSEARTRAPLVAFKSHLGGARGLNASTQTSGGGRCEIYFYDGGYGGLNNVEGDVSNLCFIVRAEDVRRCGSDAERVLREVVFRNERARWTLAGAHAVTPWLAVALESFGRHELAPAPGLLAIGDAASFIDPFTGSGMLMALESGEVAAQTIGKWLAASSLSANHCCTLDMIHADYAARYVSRFRHRLRICSLLRRAAFAPSPIIEAAALALNANRKARRWVARATRGSAKAAFP